MEASCWERLTVGETGSCSDGGPCSVNLLIQFSVDGWGCVPSLLFDLRPNCGGGNKDNGHLLPKVPCTHCYTQCPQPCSRPQLTHTSAGDSWTLPGKSGLVSCGMTAPFSWFLVHTTFCLCPPSVYPPVLCKFWQLCGGINGDLLKEGLCHIQVCCTQSPCPCSSPLLTCTSTGDTQTQFYQSLGVYGSWCTQDLFEPSERVWWEWGLILNANSPLLPSCWGLSFALGRGYISLKLLQGHAAATPVERKERYTHLNAEFERMARRHKKVFLSDQCKEIEENSRMVRLEIFPRKLEIPREHFMQRWAQ